MSFYDNNGTTIDDINREFSSSSESDDLDMNSIHTIRQRTPARTISVKEGNHFRVTRPSTTVPEETILFRLPRSFGIQEKPFDSITYSEESELAELAEKKRIDRAEALIRWRWKRDSRGEIIRDARGKPIRESNARIVKWSDGSYQLLIGDNNVIDLTLQDNVENTQYITSVEKAVNEDQDSTSEMLRVKSHLSTRLIFAPRAMAPLPEEIATKPSDGMEFLLNAPDKNEGGKGRRAPRMRNHAVHDDEMDEAYLEDEDSESNIGQIKRRGMRGDYSMSNND